jgi:hypothetical protein
MFSAFILTIRRLIQIAWYSVTDVRNLYPARILVLIISLPLITLYLIYSWTGYLLDEIFFFRYRATKIDTPVFVLGIPRSGTTFLHRTLAQDQQFTTFKTWECFFAPSITHRKIFLTLAWIDRKLGSVLGKTIQFIQKKIISWMDDIHPISLDAPEEDYFVFLPVLYLFMLVFLFPNDKNLWRMAAFDRDMNQRERKILLKFYYRNIQKHMFVFGKDKVFLSKNASFAAMAKSLQKQFPDANIFYCSREPSESLSSQISSVIPAMKLFQTNNRKQFFVDKFTNQFVYFYQYLNKLTQQNNTHFILAPMAQFKDRLYNIIHQGYDAAGLTLSDDFDEKLRNSAEKARTFSSKHQYNLESVGLDSDEIAKLFQFAKKLY